MIKKHVWIIFLFAAIFLYSSPSQAEIILEAPEKSARGDAFVARAASTMPVEQFRFYWRGKQYNIKAEASPRQGEASQAQILLPAPLDEKSASLRLEVTADGANPVKATSSVALFDRPRPTQKLKVDRKFVNPPASEKARIERDREKIRQVLANPMPGKAWELPLLRPVPGGVSSLFGMKRVFNGQPRSVHRGLDLRGAAGTPIHACADGRVALVDNLYYSGNTVYIDHGDGVFTAYLHMSEPRVKVGQMVSRGDLVGLVGATGRVTGPHLHLSLIAQGQSVDPQPLLEKGEK